MIEPICSRICSRAGGCTSSTRNSKTDLNLTSQIVTSAGPMLLLVVGLLVANSALAERSMRQSSQHRSMSALALDPLRTSESRRHQLHSAPQVPRPVVSSTYHQLTSQDLSSADQLDEPSYSSLDSSGNFDRSSSSSTEPNNKLPQSPLVMDVDHFSESRPDDYPNYHHHSLRLHNLNNHHNQRVQSNSEDSPDETMENSQEAPDRNVFIDNHNTQLRAMHDMFERRHLNNGNNQNNHHQHHHHHHGGNPLQSSQELNPISIGMDPGSPFAMPPFQMGPNDGASPPPPSMHPKPPHLSNGDNLDGNMGGPSLPFGLNPLPHLLGFQSPAFDGPQRGDQSAHSNHHTSAALQPDSELAGGGEGGGAKVWPKIFRFTDGRINLSDFEKQKKIRLSNKNQHGENHIESAPIIFDNRPLKRKSFLILHGGVFPGNR